MIRTNREMRLVAGDALGNILWLLSGKNIEVDCRHINRFINRIGLLSVLFYAEDVIVDILL